MGLQYYISTEKEKIDLDFVHAYLSDQSYWAKGRTKEMVKKTIENSICISAFTESGEQIAFARLITDQVAFAWLMDVFVAPGLRGQGIGKKLLAHIVSLPEIQNVNGIGLRTRDAHGLYEKWGFEKLEDPGSWMYRKRKTLCE